MTLTIQALAWDRHKNVARLNGDPNPPLLVAGLNQLMGILPFLIITSPMIIQI
jgi:hypothetical protein